MKIGILGFGKTAKAVISVLLESGFQVEWIIRKSEVQQYYDADVFNKKIPICSSVSGDFNRIIATSSVDVIVDFSSEDALDYYADIAASNKIAIVTAISNYPLDQLKKLIALSKQTCIFYSPNITIGINFLLIAAKVLKEIAPDADISIIEEHFTSKNDVSGTAKVIANNLDINHKEIKSIRAGGIVGTHEILFGFPYQTVRLKHESISREAFGNGIKFVLNNLPIKTAGFYNMESLMSPFFDKHKGKQCQTKKEILK